MVNVLNLTLRLVILVLPTQTEMVLPMKTIKHIVESAPLKRKLIQILLVSIKALILYLVQEAYLGTNRIMEIATLTSSRAS